MSATETTVIFAKLEALKDIKSKTLQLEKMKQRILQEVEQTEQEEKCLLEYKQEMDLLMQEKMAHVEELRQIHADINAMEAVIKQAEEARNKARETAKLIHNNDYQPLKHDIDRMRREFLGLERLPELYETESDLISPDYFDRPMQKAEWRVEVRGEDLLPPLTLHHPGHPGGSTPFLAPQPLQGPSKPEPRPLPPAPGPPAPTFRYNEFLPCLRCLHSKNSTTVISKIDKILIANRGEIACRIVRTAKKLGIRSVAIFSEADRNSLHVEQADEAYCIGPAPSSQSYLKQDKIIAIAKRSKCQAIHPGYGFLSENAEFAEFCQKQNIVFIGPPADAIKNMGIKSTSKRIMFEAGVPIIAGYHGEDQSNETLLEEAEKIGFPLMIKAVRGGGGKGMRIVSKESEFMEALESSRTESEKAFGDSAVLLEQYVNNPRHIEVQVFADKHGNVVHMFERDCSVQRRHQKIIEEAPAPGISENLRSNLGTTAVQAAKAVEYVGAGTVEFIMDRDRNNFYFMEMNTRLQVEHPITEAITGLDLVEWQLRVAAGEELPLKQTQINLQGHAFEARIYAENPREHFLPGAGTLSYMRLPEINDESIRVEIGVREKDEISVYYDPMIAKLIVWGKSRGEALAILRSKLSEYNIAGLDTNIEFLKDLCSNHNFRQGEVHTGFIDEHRRELFPKFQVPSEVTAQAILALIFYEDKQSLRSSLATNDPLSPFATEIGLRVNHNLVRTFSFNVRDDLIKAEVKYIEPEVYSIRINEIGPWRRVSGKLEKKGYNTLELCAEIDEISIRARVIKIGNTLYLFTKDREWQFNIPRTKYLCNLTSDQTGIDKFQASSPIPGFVEKLIVTKGDTVKTGDALLVINAMKMEHIIRASIDGIVKNILCSKGDNVSKDKVLVELTQNT